MSPIRPLFLITLKTRSKRVFFFFNFCRRAAPPWQPRGDAAEGRRQTIRARRPSPRAGDPGPGGDNGGNAEILSPAPASTRRPSRADFRDSVRSHVSPRARAHAPRAVQSVFIFLKITFSLGKFYNNK